ncbi:MAG: helix-turn-helix transcriptional regulator [Oscillospiraceae bacterium]|nr:helix-turn-helix transcriptional regulator [Oscillospiraceae bacterium]
MNDKWTGNLIGKMHNHKISYDDLAKKLNITKSYISMVLNGARKPPNARQRFEAAVAEIIEERSS